MMIKKNEIIEKVFKNNGLIDCKYRYLIEEALTHADAEHKKQIEKQNKIIKMLQKQIAECNDRFLEIEEEKEALIHAFKRYLGEK